MCRLFFAYVLHTHTLEIFQLSSSALAWLSPNIWRIFLYSCDKLYDATTKVNEKEGNKKPKRMGNDTKHLPNKRKKSKENKKYNEINFYILILFSFLLWRAKGEWEEKRKKQTQRSSHL